MRKRVYLLILMLVLASMACSFLPVQDNGRINPPPTTTEGTSTEEVSPTLKPSATATSSTDTPVPTLAPINTATSIPPSATPTLTPIPLPPTSYYLQPGTPVGMPNFANPAAGCKWMGLAGQVFDIAGEPVTGYVIQVEGMLGGKEVSQMGITGAAQTVGPGGFMVSLADHPVESNGSLWIQLFDQTGNSKTGKILLTTYSNCERNLILVNLVELKTMSPRILIPFLMKNVP